MTATVITPATATRLTTVDHVRGDLGLAPANPSDAQVVRFIDQASARAATFCRRTFGRETVRERLDLCRERLTESGGLLLDRGPVFRLASAAIDGTAILPGDFLVADGRELFLLEDGDPVGWRGRGLVVVYEAGWLLPGEDRGTPPSTAPDLPADIERAVIQLVGVAISIAGRDAMVKSENVEGVGSTDWYVQGASASLPHPEAEATLAQYRRMMFA